ncbi:MAG: hypothetical protein RLZZ126_644 [Pseudomonadota bacterium]|jgi:long-chain acyl-CoA synthetase
MNTAAPTDFQTLSDLIARHAAADPARRALVVSGQSVSYGDLDAQMTCIAQALRADGLQSGDVVAVCAGTSLAYAQVFLGALRAGVVVAPLPPSAAPQSLARMVQDSGARRVFVDAEGAGLLDGCLALHIRLDTASGAGSLSGWLERAASALPVDATQPSPGHPFNIIYSSGTTGDPKGIVQSHGMRWAHIQRAANFGYSPSGVTLLATPLYSNTTLVVFIPTLAYGGTVLMMPKFDVLKYLELAQQERVTHTMLVPVQYQRLMASPEFGRFDLTSFHLKFCTSAPFAPALKADVLRRWSGGLIEMYGMTEGGGACILEAHLHPDKLHTVGKPVPNHDIRLLDDNGKDHKPADCGDLVGEIVGSSGGMMNGYHGQPEKTREAEWFDAAGKRFIRTGDMGRFDADGFLQLMDRKKDMVISGGFNIYPSDIEAVLREHPQVAEAAVVGVPSAAWGETPVAFVVARPGFMTRAWPMELMTWANGRLGKTQRLAGVQVVAELPRSAIGKVLKRELRDSFSGQVA